MAELAQQELISDRYRLVRELGRGGMGSVWEAEDERLGRRVALKLMIARLARDDKALRRFEREAKAVARLNSPHIVQLLDFGVDRVPYMVLELLEGCELKEKLQDCERMPLVNVATMVAQTGKALATAHAADIVHRDLKPANIFMVRDQDDEYVKVFDFGTAKALTGFKDARTLTTLGSILGTPHYMAPEQLSGDDDVDHRADVWSLAVVAYHALTGVHPFPGDEIGEVIHGIVYAAHPPPTALDPDLPEEIDGFFEQALAKDKAERFQSARGMSAALTAIAELNVSQSMQRDELDVSHDRPRRGRAATRRGVPRIGVRLGPPSAEQADQAAASAWMERAAPSLDGLANPPSVAAPTTEAVEPSRLPRAAIGIGALVSLIVGGFGAWMALHPSPGDAAPSVPSASTAAVEPSTAPSSAPSAAASTAPSTSSSVRRPPPRRWRRPDIYEGLDE